MYSVLGRVLPGKFDFGLPLFPVLGSSGAQCVVPCTPFRRGRGRSPGASHTTFGCLWRCPQSGSGLLGRPAQFVCRLAPTSFLVVAARWCLIILIRVVKHMSPRHMDAPVSGMAVIIVVFCSPAVFIGSRPIFLWLLLTLVWVVFVKFGQVPIACHALHGGVSARLGCIPEAWN